MPPLRQSRNQLGFTPMEVVIVLIFIGIISTIIISRSDTGRTDLLAQTAVIKSHIRYAQSRAMNADRSWGFRCDDSGQRYWLFVDGDPDNKRTLPGEVTDTVDLTRYKLALTTIAFSFDSRGRPCSDANGEDLLGSDLSLTLSAGAGAIQAITITRNTGFIP